MREKRRGQFQNYGASEKLAMVILGRLAGEENRADGRVYAEI
jgi:hypothetical protein